MISSDEFARRLLLQLSGTPQYQYEDLILRAFREYTAMVYEDCERLAVGEDCATGFDIAQIISRRKKEVTG